jgi:hypothetical protein
VALDARAQTVPKPLKRLVAVQSDRVSLMTFRNKPSVARHGERAGSQKRGARTGAHQNRAAPPEDPLPRDLELSLTALTRVLARMAAERDRSESERS